MNGKIQNGIIDGALKPGQIYSEDDLHACFMKATGMNRKEAGVTRLNMQMSGELVLEPDGNFRRVKRLP